MTEIETTIESPPPFRGVSVSGGGRSSLGLQYGDIVKISAPSNEKINNHLFFIDYIDHDKLRCVDIDRVEEHYTYKIEWDDQEKEGFLIDTAIEQISLISRGEDLGYVKINRLQKGDTLLIELRQQQGPPLRAKIQEILLDAVELVDVETKETLYIDFEYKGLPEYIDKIRVIPAAEEVGIEGPLDEPIPDVPPIEEEIPVEVGRSALQILSNQGDAVFREIVSMDDVEEDLDAIEVEMEIPENQQRYTLDVQIGDVSDHLYSRFPKHLHTPELGTAILTEINRFVELRQGFSEFQENGIILPRKSEVRPLLRHFIQNTDSFSYRAFIPVVQIKKKIHVDCLDEQGELLYNEAFDVNDDEAEIRDLESAWKKYRENVQQGDENRLVHMLHTLLPMPFLKPTHIQGRDRTLFFTPIKTDVPQEYWTAQEDDPAVSLHIQTINPKKSSQCPIYDIVKLPYIKQRFLRGEDAHVSAIYVPDLQAIMDAPTPATPFYQALVPQEDPQDVLSVPLKNDDDELYAEYDENILLRFQQPKAGNKTKKNTAPPLYASKPACFHANPGSVRKINLLQKVTPTTSYLLHTLKHGGLLDDIFSLQQGVEKMAGWAVGPENIRREESQEFQLQIDKNIRDFLKEWRTRSGEWLRQARQVFAYYKPTQIRWNDLYTLFSSSPEGLSRIEQLKNAYRVDFATVSSTGNTPISNSEIMRTLLMVDNGRLFNLCLISLLMDWLSPEQFLSGIPDIGASSSSASERGRQVLKTLSKRYTTENQLEKDNQEESDVWVDEDLLDAETKEWMRKFEPILKRAKSSEEKREFVYQTLTDVNQMTPHVAEIMTDTILTGKKRVQDGEYAVLEKKQRATMDDKTHKDVVMSRQYYKRIQGIWSLDKALKDDHFGEEVGNLLQAAKTRNQTAETKEAIQFEFERRYSKIAETMKEQIDQDIEKQLRDMVRRRAWNQEKGRSLNKGMVQQANLYEEEKAENPVLSPYASLRDLVLAQYNEQKRQYDIVRFFQQVCRKATLTENQNWGYCRLTNTRLFPVSIYELAVVFNTGKTRDYNRKLAQTCSLYGVVSDDGGSWVDRESGYTICLLDQVADGSDSLEYRRLAVAEQELKEAEIQTVIETLFASEEQEKNDVVSVLFRFFNRQTGIQESAHSPLFNEINVLYQNTILDPRIIISEKKYKASLAKKYANVSAEELAKRTRSEPTYEIYMDRMHVYVAVSSYFAVLQLHRREIKRSNLGGPVECSFTLSGFPQIEDPEKDGGIRYMACILQNTAKIDQHPWKSMNQQSLNVMVKNIKVVLQNMVANTPSLKNALKALGPQEEEEKPQPGKTHIHWPHFLPPIVPFSVKSLLTGEQQAQRLYLDEFKNARKNKDAARLKLKGLGLLLTYGIVERINDIVLKKKMLMKTMSQVPFLENTCCDDDNRSRNPAFYFCQEDPTLLKYIQYSRDIDRDVQRISTLSFPPLLFYRGLTWATTFQTSVPVIQESTVKYLFIHFLYDKNLWNRPDIQALYSFPAPPDDYDREWTPVKKMAMFQETVENSGKWADIRPLHIRFIQKMNQDRIKKIRQPEQDAAQLRRTRFLEKLQILGGQSGNQTLYNYLLEEHEETPITVRKIEVYRKPLLTHLNINGTVVPARFLTVSPESLANNRLHLRNALLALTSFLPLSIIKERQIAIKSIPEHWVFTESDLIRMQMFIKKNTVFFQSGKNPLLTPLLVVYLEKVAVLRDLLETIPEEMFSPEVLWNLYSYMLVEVLYLHWEAYFEMNAVSETPIKSVLKEYLTTTLDKMDVLGSWVEMSYEEIRQKTQMDADQEKNTMKQYLKEMSNEERKVENEMKKNKLGRWNVGKEIFIYDKRKQSVGSGKETSELMNLFTVDFLEDFEKRENEKTEMNELDQEAAEDAEAEDEGYDVDEGYDDNGDEEGDYFED